MLNIDKRSDEVSILKVKDQSGNIIDIPAIKGKSAYQSAVDGGYKGTEEEFNSSLANIKDLSGRPTNTIEGLGELSAATRTDLASFDAIAIGAFEGDFLFDKIPIGAEIKSIEFRLEGSTEWIDIKSMFEYDGIPYVINMNHAVWGYDYAMFDKMFALITFLNGMTNFLYDAAAGGNNGDTRITYYTDNIGGEANA